MMVKSVVNWATERLQARYCVWPARVGDEMPQARLLRTAFGVNDGAEEPEVVRWAPLRGQAEAGLVLAFEVRDARVELFGLVDYRLALRPEKRFGFTVECDRFDEYAKGARLMPWPEHEVVVWGELQAVVSGPYAPGALEVVRIASEWWNKTLRGKSVMGRPREGISREDVLRTREELEAEYGERYEWGDAESKRVTLRDIADRLGVSIDTVQRRVAGA